MQHLLWIMDEVPPVQGIWRFPPLVRLWAHCLWNMLSGHCMFSIETDEGVQYACSQCEFRP